MTDGLTEEPCGGAGPGWLWNGKPRPWPGIQPGMWRILRVCGGLRWALIVWAMLSPVRTWAVMIFRTGDPAANTTEPGGELAGSGWQWQGVWGGFLGTAISPRVFITANHVLGSIGQEFHFAGLPFRTVRREEIPGTDLSVWEVAGRMPMWAPIYTNRSEVGLPAVLIGNGTQRGEEIQDRGWKTGLADGVRRWGTNEVEGVEDFFGDLLECRFDQAAGGDEAMLSSGDSGGPLFVRDTDGAWKLAGIHFAVSGPFSPDTNAAPFFGAFYDTAGWFEGLAGQQERLPRLPRPRPASCYSSRISSSAAAIGRFVAGASDAGEPRIESTEDLGRPFSPEAGYAVDAGRGVITVVGGQERRFFRVSGAGRISAVALRGANVEITYAREVPAQPVIGWQ
jgi:hypothetical protein